MLSVLYKLWLALIFFKISKIFLDIFIFKARVQLMEMGIFFFLCEFPFKYFVCESNRGKVTV